MIELKEAISSAKAFINEINGAADGAQVEEAFISTDETYWAVTVSYFVRPHSGDAGESTRMTKMVHIDKQSGEVTGMYNQS